LSSISPLSKDKKNGEKSKGLKRKESVIPGAELPPGAETKKKAKYPSKGLIFWECGTDHHLRGCKDINDEQKAKIIECRRRHKTRVDSVLGGES